MKKLLLLLLCAPWLVCAQNSPRRIDTLTNLVQSVNPKAVSSNGKVDYLVHGRYAVGDWGPARVFSAKAAGTTNNANRFNSAANAAYDWVADDANADTQDLRWWTGYPDDALDDSAAIQSWHDSLEGKTTGWGGWTNAVGGTLFIPKGNWILDNQVVITNLVHIRGAGEFNTVIQATGTNTAFKIETPYFSGSYQWAELSDFSLWKSRTNQTGQGIYQQWNGSSVRLHDISIDGFVNGVAIGGWLSNIEKVTVQYAAEDGIVVFDTLPAGINPTAIRFEHVQSKSNGRNGFTIENSSYLHFSSCVSEWHTNGIGWNFYTTSNRTVFASQNSTTLINCSSEMDHEAAVFANCNNIIWYGGMLLPRVPGQDNESTNIVRFIGPNQVRLDRINTEMGYTPTFGGYTVFCEDLGYGWPHLVEINGGSWRRMLFGRENRPGTVKWNAQWTMPTSFPILGASQTGFTNISAGSIGFDLGTAGQTIGTNDFSLLLDVTWPDYVGSSEIIAHITTGSGWSDPNAFFVQLNADSKLELATYNGATSANRIQAKGTNTLMAFSGQRAKVLVSRSATDGARMWIGGKQIKLQEYETGTGGSFATNTVPGTYLHFGNRLAGTRWLYHGGALLNYAVTDDAQALGIVDHGPTALLPWATFGSGTNGVVLNWALGPEGDWRDGSPHKIPGHKLGTTQIYGQQEDLWRLYGIDKINVTNSSASSTILQNTGTAPGVMAISNAWGGTIWTDKFTDTNNKTARLGMGNYAGTGTMPMGLIGGNSYLGGGDVYFGGYNTVLFTKPSGYYWAFGSTNTDTAGWLGMTADRGSGFHIVNPGVLRIGTNLVSSSSNATIAQATTDLALQLIAPGRIDMYPGYPAKSTVSAKWTSTALAFDEQYGLSFDDGATYFTNLGPGLAISGNLLYCTVNPFDFWPDLTNALVAGANVSFAYDTGAETITINASAGSGSATNGTAVSFEGTYVPEVNVVDSDEIDFTMSGTNLTAWLKDGSVATNRIDTTFYEWVESMAGGSGSTMHANGTPITNLTDTAEIAYAVAAGAASPSLVDGSIATNRIDSVFYAWIDSKGGAATNATLVSVDGANLTEANFADSSELLVTATGTNVTYALAANSIATNKIDSTFRTWVESMASTNGVTDGDKGDITVSGSGATWTIDNDVVTYAKMQNVSAASRLLGRGDSGSGDPQELTAGPGLLISGTELKVDTSGLTDGFYAGGYLPLYGGISNFIYGPLHLRRGTDIRMPFWETNSGASDEYLSMGLRMNAGTFSISEFNTNDFTVAESFMDFIPGDGTDDYIYLRNSGFDNHLVIEAEDVQVDNDLNVDGVLKVGTTNIFDKIVAAANRWPSGSTMSMFNAAQAHAPSSNPGSFGTRNAIPMLEFDPSTQEQSRWVVQVPTDYATSTVTVVLRWTTDATSGNGRWGVRFWDVTGVDVDSATFATAGEATTACSGTAGTTVSTSIGSISLDSASAGDVVIMEVYRDVGDAADTINSNDLQLMSVEVRAE